MTLSTFEWMLVVGIAVLLVSIIGSLIVMLIKDMRTRMSAEALARKKGDLDLAGALKEVTDSLHSVRVENIEAHGQFVKKDDAHRIYEKLEDIRNTVTEIKANMVTKDECLARCAAAGA